MIKHELLVPAGDMESLNQAIANGADAVYLGCKNFGARKFAKNFDNNEIQSAVRLCHLYGVKVYVTMNTLIKDNEVPMFLGQVEYLYKVGVDAILMQDFGMINLVREKYPELEIHASTQANTSSAATAELYYNLGIKRVVFSREMSLEEIEAVKVPIEKEAFVHGALCISYSGCCLMSSMLGNRSGNRGECAGCCRLPYELRKGTRVIASNKYVLSTKELNTSTRFKELLDSSITSFKLEGRMKSPEYVGFITKFYRSLIDSNCTNVDVEGLNKQLKTIFNRGFTEGYIFNTEPQELMNSNTPNHIGLEIGKVVDITQDKIKIELFEDLNQEDGIRFLNSGKGFIVNFLYDKDMNLTNSVPKGNICYVDNKIELKELDTVNKTLDIKLMNELKKMPVRRIPVTIQVRAHVGLPLEVEMSDGEHAYKVIGNVVQQSINAPVTKQRLREQIEKLGETPFISQTTIIDSDPDIFIPMKELNELRRTLAEKLIQVRMNKTIEFKTNDVKLTVPNTTLETGITASVYTQEQLEMCNRFKLKRIYVSDYELYKQNKMLERVYYVPNRCSRNPMVGYDRRAIVSDYFDFTKKEELIGDYGLNVTNVYTAYYLYKMGLKVLNISVELSENEIIDFINNYVRTFNKYPSLEIVGYGRVENMITKGNILNLSTKVYNEYELKDIKDRVFPVLFDGVNTHVLNHEKRNIAEKELLKKYASMRLDFYDETGEEVRKVIEQFI